MKLLGIGILFVCLFAIFAISTETYAKISDIEIEVSLNRDTIGLNEQVILQITVSSSERNLPAPHLPTLPMFKVYSQGRSSNISITNGAVNATLTYRYILTPQKAGTFPIEQVSIVHKNKRFKGNSVELTVLSQGVATPKKLEGSAKDSKGNSRDYFLEASVDKKHPYVGQQVTLTLKFYIAVQNYGSPELSEPSMTGFWSEVIGNKPVYFQRINNRRYKVSERKYALFPTQTGELTIGRAMISATIATRRNTRDPFSMFGNVFGRGKDITVRSDPVTVNVKTLPTKKKPKDFTGTVGKFSITASADKRKVEVNQPVTVVFKITGVGNIKSVAEPAIPDLPDFRIYRASSSENTSRVNDKLGGTKIYEEVFIPGRPGDMTIPSISYNYFDPENRKYQTIKTKPIKISVIKPEGYVAAPQSPFQPNNISIGNEARDIRYIKTDLGDTQPIGEVLIFRPIYIAVNGLPLAILAGLILIRKRREKIHANLGYARSRSALRMARKRLSKASKLSNRETVLDFYAELNSALVSYIADKLNISPHGLTTDKVRELLSEREASEELIADIINIIQKCDYARYAPSTIEQEDIDESLKTVGEVMVGIEGVKFD
ncbi:MAG: BatD family protein [candidate division Zixibacteria bacterium]